MTDDAPAARVMGRLLAVVIWKLVVSAICAKAAVQAARARRDGWGPEVR
jgi:hypothetical protein